jgi:CheY-like chemotaxis protein
MNARQNCATLPHDYEFRTANAMQDDREKYFAAGMNDYVSKPLAVQDLERVLEQWGRRP